MERVSDRYFLRKCAGKPADRVFTRTKFNAEPAGIFYRRRVGRLYDIFYVQLRYAAIIAGARICYRCAKRGLKHMRLYAVLLRWAARGQSACRLAVGGLLGVYFGTSQAHRVRRETQKKWLLVLYVVLFALALKKVLQ